jgi:hypothetical protein
MKTIAGAVLAAIVLAAIVLAGSMPAVAGGNPTDSRPKPSSYVSQPRTNRHVYGSPIEPPVVGRAAHHAHKKQSTGATTRSAHKAPAHKVR